MKLLIILLSLFSLQTMAADEPEKTYRYPSDLTDDEYQEMMSYRESYSSCLKSEAKENLDKYEDFRKVADVAMENCKTMLTKIDDGLAAMKLDPDFRRYFIRKASQKSAQKLLPDLMAAKSK